MIEEPTPKDVKVAVKPRPKAKPRSKKDTGSTNIKTIKTPGATIERVAQACDRCRAKKTKCDGKLPSCSSCAAVGFKCIVSDKLSRRAFPKGYTEILEERIRQLETENKKLVSLVDLRDEQIGMLNGNKVDDDRSYDNEANSITPTNLMLLENTAKSREYVDDHEESCPCGCSNPHAVHERPVSIAGSLYENNNGSISIASSINLSDEDDDNSLVSIDDIISLNSNRAFLMNKSTSGIYSNREISPAPGAFAAATAIAQMQKNKTLQQQQQENENDKQQLLTALVALSIPRSTEETLFIPTLLARICQAYGYNSKPAILTANAIASLKENSNGAMKSKSSSGRDTEMLLNIIMNRDDITKLEDAEASYFVRNLIDLPTSRIDLDQLISTYFSEWGSAFPILDKNSFLKNYVRLTNILDSNNLKSESEAESSYESIEKFGAIMILVLSLSLLAKKEQHITGASKNNENDDSYVSYLNHYDFLIHEFIKPNCIITKYCSIQSLQILSLALQYCLVIGDITTCYELRGRVITMAHQLRLHRCPAAVLGISGSGGASVNLQNFMQGERRILFWCIYCLDVYSSLNLGVPRLLKDFEIECALPFSGKNDDDNDENENILIINNTKLSIVGKVSKFALSIMLYCKVLGKILDSIFSRFENDNAQGRAIDRDRILDCWRRDLPSDLKFEIDVNGFSIKNNSPTEGNWKEFSKQQKALVFLYYHAKILIYLPIISKYGNHHNVGLSKKEQLSKDGMDVSNIVSSISMIQSSSIQILEVLRTSVSYFLPIPINIAREQARFSLLVAKGSLDYIKGGPLYQNSKTLLLESVSSLSEESNFDIPGGLTKSSVKVLELAILSILGLSLNKNAIKKKSPISNQPITKMAVSRDPLQIKQIARGNRHFNNGFENSNDEILNSLYQPQQQMAPTSTESAFLNNQDEFEGLESILKFDPFKVNFNKQHSINEFAADGSLGLVPFLDDYSNDLMLNMYNQNNDNMETSSFNYGTMQHSDNNLSLNWP